MKLGELFAGIEPVPPEAEAVEVRALTVDSRAAGPGALFAGLPGVNADGLRFAPQAIAAGASAVLGSAQVAGIPCVVSPRPRRAFALAASRFHGEPSRHLQLLGVTGTNGKTTTTYLVEQLAAARGLRAGLLGTVEVRWPGQRLAATHTTPESHELQALLSRMVADGVQLAAMEVSSHALSQDRVTGCRFAAAAFTNLSRDHLDYHGTLEAYFEAKARLFRELLPAGAPAVLNLDDPRCAGLAAELAAEARVRTLGFSLRGNPQAALCADGLQVDLSGLRFSLRSPFGQAKVACPLLGAHNAENLLAAFGLLLGLGWPLAELVAAARTLRGAPGRLERVPDSAGRTVLVDYAHSDDALARALTAVRVCAGSQARLISVFGCGGDRDRGKRPLMGRVAAQGSQLCIATSDNPRTEDPAAILAEIEPGLRQGGGRRLSQDEARAGAQGYCIVPDRAEAIALAAACARKQDAVLIAGKGHEDYQIVGTQKRHFDDREEAARALAAHPPARTQEA